MDRPPPLRRPPRSDGQGLGGCGFGFGGRLSSARRYAPLRAVPTYELSLPLPGRFTSWWSGWKVKINCASGGPSLGEGPGIGSEGACVLAAGCGPCGGVGVASLLGRAPKAYQEPAGGATGGGPRRLRGGSRFAGCTPGRTLIRATPARPRRETTPGGSLTKIPWPGPAQSPGPQAPTLDIDSSLGHPRPLHDFASPAVVDGGVMLRAVEHHVLHGRLSALRVRDLVMRVKRPGHRPIASGKSAVAIPPCKKSPLSR